MASKIKYNRAELIASLRKAEAEYEAAKQDYYDKALSKDISSEVEKVVQKTHKAVVESMLVTGKPPTYRGKATLSDTMDELRSVISSINNLIHYLEDINRSQRNPANAEAYAPSNFPLMVDLSGRRYSEQMSLESYIEALESSNENNIPLTPEEHMRLHSWKRELEKYQYSIPHYNRVHGTIKNSTYSAVKEYKLPTKFDFEDKK